MNLSSPIHHLSIEIKYLREKLVTIGIKEGLTSPKTIKISQDLDRLLNQFFSTGISRMEQTVQKL